MLYVFLYPKTGDCSWRLCHRTEGDMLRKSMAEEVAPSRLAQRPALLCVLWRVSAGLSNGLEYDGGLQCSPPQFQVPPFFVGTCIYANISCKWHHSLVFARGKWSQDNKQVCVAVHPVTTWVEWNSGKHLFDCCLLMTLWSLIKLTCLWVFALQFNLMTGMKEISEMTACFW